MYSPKMRKSRSIQASAHAVYDLHVHLVFVTKYRRRVITERVFLVLRGAWEPVCRTIGCRIVEANFEPDHVHLLVEYPPRLSISVVAGRLKASSATSVRAEKLPEVMRFLWGAHFWSESYCAVSCGGAPLDVIKQYIDSQRGAPAPSMAAPPRPSLPLSAGVPAAERTDRSR